MTTRREFMTMLGGAAAAWPLAARAQPTVRKRPLIGFLGTSAKIFGARYFEGFTQGMSEFGYRDYSLEDRYANNDLGRLRAGRRVSPIEARRSRSLFERQRLGDEEGDVKHSHRRRHRHRPRRSWPGTQ